MKNLIVFGLMVGLSLLMVAPVAYGQDATGSWGLGLFADYNRPVYKLGDWYSDGNSDVGLVFSYVVNPNMTAELEYHRSTWDHGSLEDRMFTWEPDGEKYKSPEASSSMKINSFLVNWLFRGKEPLELKTMEYAPYLAVGAGLYDYKTNVSGLIFPGQTTPPLDKTFLLEPFSDTRTALGLNFGGGLEGFIFDNISLDFRVRGNVLLGELRPMEAWGIEGQTFPMVFWNFRGGAKFYFRK